jgi:polyferredoxin/Pyruvate/2-oxoacid:ferredoxin oxidoreductase delta subunit
MRKRRFHWKPLRIVVQVTAFLAVIVYFLSLVYPLPSPWRPDLLFQLDPLMHIYLLLSGNGIPHWVFAVIALLLLLVLQRIFCGWLCPLGALLDLISGIRGRLKLWNRNKTRTPGSERRQPSILPAHFSLYLLVAFLVLAAFGNPLIWVLDPIVFIMKFLTVGLLPIIDGPLRLGFESLDNQFYMSQWWHPVADGFNAYFVSDNPPIFADTTLFLAFAVLIFGLEFWQRRFWCRYVCPIGALNGLAYKLSPLRRRVAPACTRCLRCETACHFGGTNEADCFYCMECIDDCRGGAISFLPLPKGADAQKHPVAKALPPASEGTRDGYRARLADEVASRPVSRRLLLEYAALGLVAYPALRLLDGRKELPLDFIRPPGVGTDDAKFTELCIKCGQCLKVCLTGGLQPAITEAGLSGLWTPHLVSRLGDCAFECNLCGRVCPSGAIPNLPLEEKKLFKIGVAVIDKMRCIPYITSHNCSVCEEHCPTPEKAILLSRRWITNATGEREEQLRPYVDEMLCIGCGICERVCPVVGLSAIRVYRRPPGPAYDENATGGYGGESADDSYGSGYGSSGGDYSANGDDSDSASSGV